MLGHVGAWRAVSSELVKAVVQWHKLPRFRRQHVSSRHCPVMIHRMVCHGGFVLALNTRHCIVYVFRIRTMAFVHQWRCYDASHPTLRGRGRRWRCSTGTHAWDLAVSRDGRVFVVADEGHIGVFGVAGTLVDDWRVDLVDRSGQLDHVAVSSTRVFVTQDPVAIVHVLNLGDGLVLRSWKANARISGLCVTNAGLVALVTVPNREIRVEVRDEWGVVLHSWRAGRCASPFWCPMHVVVRGSHLFVSRADPNRIDEYHITGTRVSVWDGGQEAHAIAGTREGHLILVNSRRISVYA